jgi:hypothetical protein
MNRNALPGDFAFPSPAQSTTSRKQMREVEERDILDDLVIKDKMFQPA